MIYDGGLWALPQEDWERLPDEVKAAMLGKGPEVRLYPPPED